VQEGAPLNVSFLLQFFSVCKMGLVVAAVFMYLLISNYLKLSVISDAITLFSTNLAN
jgi:hypothetical protein